MLDLRWCKSKSRPNCKCSSHSFYIPHSKLPILRSFLKDGHAESYEGVTVAFVNGREATLVIYDAGDEVDRIMLQNIGNMADLHRVMVDAGFSLKPERERTKLVEKATTQQAHLRAMHHKHNEYYRIRQFYIDEFRRNVVLESIDESEISRPLYRKGQDLVDNFDRINHKKPILKEELLQSARDYLALMHSQ